MCVCECQEGRVEADEGEEGSRAGRERKRDRERAVAGEIRAGAVGCDMMEEGRRPGREGERE